MHLPGYKGQIHAGVTAQSIIEGITSASKMSSICVFICLLLGNHNPSDRITAGNSSSKTVGSSVTG